MCNLVELKNFLYGDKRSFMLAFNNDENVVNKYILGVYNTVVNNQDLLKCSPESIRDAAITSAVLDVPIDARQYAWLIPYGTKAQFQLGYKGYVHVAKRDPDVDSVVSTIVYPDDEFSFDIGNNTIQHVPDLDSDTYGKEDGMKFVYAVVRFRKDTGRAPMFEVMTKKQVEAIREKAKQKYIWTPHYGEMSRKTVIKRLLKHAQLGDVAVYDQVDNAAYDDKIINVTPGMEIVVDDSFTSKKNEIIAAVEACTSSQELQDTQAKYQDDVQEISLYNTSASKEIMGVMGKSADSLYMEDVTEFLRACEDEESLDKVYQAHEKRINQLKAANRNATTQIYCELKQHFVDAA